MGNEEKHSRSRKSWFVASTLLAATVALAAVGYATIARLHHIDFEENGNDCYTDIWREFPGVREVMELDTEPQAAD